MLGLPVVGIPVHEGQILAVDLLVSEGDAGPRTDRLWAARPASCPGYWNGTLQTFAQVESVTDVGDALACLEQFFGGDVLPARDRP